MAGTPSASGANDGATAGGASSALPGAGKSPSAGTAGATPPDTVDQAGNRGDGPHGGSGNDDHGHGGDGATPNGSAGEPTSGGQADENAGQPGVAGQPPLSAAGEACVACGAGQCGELLNSCRQNPECGPWLACLSACDSQDCARACDATYADVARVYYGVYRCLCDTCEAACTVADSCNKQCVDDGVLPPTSSAPGTLAETGLYAMTGGDPAKLAAHVYPYEAKYPLWADGAGKDRYIFIPRCATIDTKDMDHWEFPVGTRLWKHFSVDGKLVETRMIHRYGSGAGDWLYATYGWNDAQPNDPTAAVSVLHGEPSANGTLHDIPDPSACPSCHGKLPDKPLGFSAFQLSHGGDGLTMQKLSDWGWLSVPARGGFAVPGTPVQQAALGYLHGNCGGCHNSFGQIPREDPMLLRLNVAQTDYAQTDTLRTTIGVPTINSYPELHGKPRIDPQAPENSAIYLRMSDRNKFPMPPLATKFADTDGGVAAITAWIDSLPKP